MLKLKFLNLFCSREIYEVNLKRNFQIRIFAIVTNAENFVCFILPGPTHFVSCVCDCSAICSFNKEQLYDSFLGNRTWTPN